MVRIRLRRMGAKKKPFYRIVVANQRSPRDGRFIETIGTYNPLTDPATIEVQADRVVYWLNAGAQPSDSVAQLLRRQGIIDETGAVIYQPESEEEETAPQVAEESVEENAEENAEESSEAESETAEAAA